MNVSKTVYMWMSKTALFIIFLNFETLKIAKNV